MDNIQSGKDDDIPHLVHLNLSYILTICQLF